MQQVLSHGLLLSRRDRARDPTDRSRLVGGLLLKLLCRGRTPLPTLGVERQALESHGLLGRVSEFGEKSAEVGWQPRSRAGWRVRPGAVLAVAVERDPFVLDPAIDPGAEPDGSLCGSDLEVRFLREWTLEALGPESGHWFTPQASLDRLLRSQERSEGVGARRVDFLFCHPGGPPLVVEIDGPEHDDARQVDEARDDALRSIGIDVVRVPNEEMRRFDGPNLRRVRDRCQEAFAAVPPPTGEADRAVAAFAVDCAAAAKMQAAVARAIAYGWLTGGADWQIDIRGAGAAAAAGVRDVLDLLAGFGELHGWHAVPANCTVRADGGDVSAWTPAGGEPRDENADSRARAESLRITVESRASPFHLQSDQSAGERPDFVIRPAFLPVQIATELSFPAGSSLSVGAATWEEVEAPLTLFLQTVFRKRRFRSGQAHAIWKALRREDCVVLLPTGAGKSIIYQLAGLLMPGLTLVVAPLIALIEDQVEGLRVHGLDRAVGISSANDDATLRRQLRVLESNGYQFALVAPERLRTPGFRKLRDSLPVNLAVVDEAHCVSEWGHDFRPAYLHLGDSLRKFNMSGTSDPPPLLALTGTASLAVRQDMLVDLDVDRNRSDALVLPESFDRPEIRFQIARTSPRGAESALKSVLNDLPANRACSATCRRAFVWRTSFRTARIPSCCCPRGWTASTRCSPRWTPRSFGGCAAVCSKRSTPTTRALCWRALAEEMCSNRDEDVVRQWIVEGVRSAVERYEMPPSGIESAVARMFDLAATRANGLAVPLTATLLDLARAETSCAFVARSTTLHAKELAGSSSVPSAARRQVSSVLMADAMERTVDELRRAADRTIRRWGNEDAMDEDGE